MTDTVLDRPPARPQAAGIAGGAGRRLPVWAAGVAVLAVSGALHLGDRELWLDEVFSLAATRDLGETVARTHGTMSLYYALLTPWSQISTSPAWLRLLSLVLMTGALAVFSTLMARQHGRRVGTLAGLVAACSYLPTRYAVEVRSYALVALLATVAWYALDRVVSDDDPARRWARLHVACLVLLPFAHGLAVLQVAAQLAAVLVSRPSRRVLRHQLAATAGSLGVVAFLLAFGIEEVGNWLDPLSRRNLDVFFQELLHPLPAVALVVAALVGAGAVGLLRSGGVAPGPDAGHRGGSGGAALARFRSLTLICWGPGAVALLLALSVVRPSQLGRYSLSAAFGLAGLVAVALDRLARRHLRGSVAPMAFASVLLLLLTSHLAIGGDPSTWRDASAVVASSAEPGDVVLFRDPEVRLPFEVAWLAGSDRPGLAVLGPGEPLGALDRYQPLLDPEALAGSTAAGTRVWFVDQDLAHATNRQPSVLADADFRARFAELDRWHLSGGVTVFLLRAR